MQSAIDQGITLFDTSETYGPYHSERLLGRALGARRKDVVLVTKVGFAFQDDPDHPGQVKIRARDSSARNIVARAEGCLRRLGTDVIDLLLIHFHDHTTPHEETLSGLQQLLAAGKIRYYGVSNYTTEMMAACGDHGRLTTNQVGYHLLDRRVEKAVLPYCRAQGIGFMAYGTLAFGLLSGAFSPRTRFVEWDWRSRGDAFGLPLFQREHFLKALRAVERLKALAAGYDKSVAQLAIAWLLGRPGVTVALGGHAQRARAQGECSGCRLAAERRRLRGHRPNLVRRGPLKLSRCRAGDLSAPSRPPAPACRRSRDRWRRD